MKMKKYLSLILALVMVCALFTGCGKQAATTSAPASTPSEAAAPAEASSDDPASITGSIMMYTALKEKQMVALKEAFNAKYPNIVFDYYAAGAGSIMTKLATEKEAGKVGADLIWLGEPTYMLNLKEQDMLEPYESPEAAAISDVYKDPDNAYIGARLVVMGLAYNTNLVTGDDIPTKWEDILNECFKGQVLLTDPVESGTMGYCVGALMENPKYGLEYFKQIKEVQEAELNNSATNTHNDVAAGGYKICIAVDYVTQTLSSAGSPIQFVYPEDDVVVITGPLAIAKDSEHMTESKLFYDWIISAEGQQALADAGATPVRAGVVRNGSTDISELEGRIMDVNVASLGENTNKYFDDFDALYKK